MFSAFRFALLAVCAVACCPLVAAEKKASSPPKPLPVEESLKKFRLPPGLKIEPVAAEPLVVDPVAIRFDEHGRMWVVEMRDYPHGPATPDESPQSKIRILEDRDGDGRFEMAATFADNLLFVTGVMPWQGGVFVTMAGQVAYMKDTNGDGRADKTETWYTGFAQQNTQLRANHPRLGLDNRVYIANGLRGGSVVDARVKGSKPLSISGMDFRFDPLTGKFEAVSGVGQFGLTFDDYGNRFVVSNRNPVKHIVIENEYLQRNPGVRIGAVFHDVAKAGADSRVFPISRAWTTSTLHAGQFTAACGVKIYRGDALGAAYYGNAFTCDPTGNFVHREVVKSMGATFTSQPGRQGVEFLASTEEWFRPVNMEVGPDGALYVVDMHRAVIEHPQFMPEELKRRPDLRHGDNAGRIYRIVPANWKRKRLPPPAKLTIAQLVGQFDTDNAWQRETAARLLLERQDKSVIPLLEKTVTKGSRATARAQALWLLKGLGALKQKHVEAALSDRDGNVRRQALRLAEPWLSDDALLRTKVIDKSRDSDPAVRFQVALSLAPIRDRDRVELFSMLKILLAGDDDVWTRRAVSLAAANQSGALAAAVLAQTNWSKEKSAGRLELVRDLATQTGKLGRDQQLLLLRAISRLQPSVHDRVAWSTLLAMLRSARTSPKNLLAGLNENSTTGAINALVARAGRDASETRLAADARGEAVELISYTVKGQTVISQLALSETSQPVRLRAIASLSRYPGLESWRKLLAGYRGESPAVRQAIMNGLLARSDRTSLLLDEVEQQRLKAVEIDRTSAGRLLKSRDPKIRSRAAKLLAAAIPVDRKKVLAEYQPVLKLKADPQRGLAVFKKNCAICHRIGDIGVNVAPDIADSRTKQPAQILADVLQPNRAIDANYVSYTVTTDDGVVLTGILASETSTSITLRQQENKTVTLLRTEIDELRSNGVSLMPEGLEKEINHQQMADLISFIKNWRYLDGRTPLGK